LKDLSIIFGTFNLYHSIEIEIVETVSTKQDQPFYLVQIVKSRKLMFLEEAK
jgi:hypothetical protein